MRGLLPVPPLHVVAPQQGYYQETFQYLRQQSHQQPELIGA